jgi:hypothetical protein
MTEILHAPGWLPDAPPPPPTPPAITLPPPPTRDQVCGVRIGFQGLTAVTAQYGTFPMFGPETTTLDDADLDAYCAEILAQGFTHGEIAVSWQYAEPGFLMPVPGRDLSQDLPELVRRVTRMLTVGKLTAVGVFLAGDGRSLPPNPDGSYPYNDPVGHTYGYEWLLANLPRIVAGFQQAPAGDLTKYVFFCPGYDGVFYGWGDPPGQPDQQPARIRAFGALFRQVCPLGHLALEHDIGHIPTGEGVGDWAPGGTCADYDIVLSEFPNWPETGDPVWQVAGRLVPTYTRPPDQPAGDDPSPPHYLTAGSARGPTFAVAYEYATYVWTRGRVSLADMQKARAYYKALGYRWVC